MNSTSTKSTQANTEHQNINWISQTSQNLCEGFAMSTVFQRLSLRLPNWDTHIKMRLMPRQDGDEDTANVELAWQVAFGDLGLGNWASLSSDLGLGIILPLERFSCHSLITPASYQPSQCHNLCQYMMIIRSCIRRKKPQDEIEFHFWEMWRTIS